MRGALSTAGPAHERLRRLLFFEKNGFVFTNEEAGIWAPRVEFDQN
jgi:hypothetical protein